MRIAEQNTVNTISNSQASGVYTPQKSGIGVSTGSPDATTSASDRVDLGHQSDLVAQAQTAGVDDRAARIAQLSALVQSGQYQVDPKALSESIVQAALNGG